MTAHKISRVAIIGAGAAGLCACRHLAALPHRFEPIVFEQSNSVGGTWKYTDNVDAQSTAMYENLITNIPVEAMAFPSFPFPSNTRSFVSHRSVLHYLESYARHYGLDRFVRFMSSVELVRPIEDRFALTWRNLQTGVVCQDVVDAVFVCSGHYNVPKSPRIAGIERFSGRSLHSKFYRHPEAFSGERVVVCGGAASAVDVALDIDKCAVRVFLAHHHDAPLPLVGSNIEQVSDCVELVGDSDFLCERGERVERIDAIVFATGYHYSFPFLDDSACRLHDDDHYLSPLYKHLVHIDYQSLFFIGLCFSVSNFPNFDVQVRYCLAALVGDFQLPITAEMREDALATLKWRTEKFGLAKRHVLRLGNQQWNYLADLCDESGIECLRPVVERLYRFSGSKREENMVSYKRRNYRLVNDEEWEERQAEDDESTE